MPPSFIRRQPIATKGLKENVKLIYMPGWHQPETVLELLVNKDRWNALDRSEQRGVLDAACQAMLQQTLGESAQLRGAGACRDERQG